MILSILLFFLIFGLVLFVGGFLYIGHLKYGSQILHIAGAFLILMCGLIILVQGIEFKTGSIITTINTTSTVIDYQYTSLKGLQESFGVSVILIFIAFAMFLYSFFEIKYDKGNTNYSEEED
jgi:hypothetical protein